MPIREALSERERLCLLYNPFQGDETDVRVLNDAFVTTRYQQRCQVCLDDIPAGARVRARREINNEDRKAMTFYFCEPCCAAMARCWKDDGRAIEARTGIGMVKARQHG